MSLDFRGSVFSDRRKPGEINVQDFLLFFKIKQQKDFESVCPQSYAKFVEAQASVENTFSSFRGLPIRLSEFEPSSLVPHFLWSRLEASERLLREEALEAFEFIVGQSNFQRISCFFQKFPSEVLNKLDFKINTVGGQVDIKLVFAENFRFKDAPNSFNIFNLQKELRNVIIPQDADSKIFVADFRQFEFRTFLNIQGVHGYFKHERIYDEIGKDLKIKQNPKESIISYLYGSKNASLESFFRKEELIDRIKDSVFWFENEPVFVKEDYETGKTIHTINQTISQYVYLNKLNSVLDLLKDKRSKFIFPHHDSVIISLSKDEDFLVDEILEILEDDIYKVKCYIGENYRDLIEI